MKQAGKIVHICLNGSYTDGFNYQDNLLSKYHRKLGYLVTLLAPQWSLSKEGKIIFTIDTDYYNTDGIYIRRLSQSGKRKNSSRKLKRYEHLYHILEEEKPDCIFLHNLQMLDTLTICKYMKIHPQVLLYVDNHADFSNSGTNFISRFFLHKGLWKFCAQKINPYTKKFYGVLPARVDWLVNMYGLPPEKCELLVMGADDSEIERVQNSNIREAVRQKYCIDKTDTLVITGGKIDCYKLQILTLAQLIHKKQDTHLKLLIFGSVDDKIKPQLDALCDGKYVCYIGWITGNESYDLFSAADIIAFPGRHSVYWEQAVAMGVPLICKYWPGTTHIDIGGNVKFLMNDSADEMLCALNAVLNNYREFYKNSQKEARKLFWYSSIAKKSIEIQ